MGKVRSAFLGAFRIQRLTVQSWGMKNFALTGVAGFVAPRHLRAIRDTGNHLLAAADPHDGVGILDSYFPNALYFKECERLEQYLQGLSRLEENKRAHFLSVCSPNHLHASQIRMGLRAGADVICEKPLVLGPSVLDELSEIEQKEGKKVSSILQLRLHPAIRALKDEISRQKSSGKKDVVLTYITSRGPWYLQSWKGDPDRSGGLATNIGIHFFDMLIWIFGRASRSELHLSEPTRASGALELEGAQVRWYLSIDRQDLPEGAQGSTYRHISIDGVAFEFSDGFTDLHTESYKEILQGRGFGNEEARSAIEIAYRLRTALAIQGPQALHPFLEKRIYG